MEDTPESARMKEYKAQYYQKNKTRLDARNRQWALEHREKFIEYHRRYYEEHKDEQRARSLAWYHQNTERAKARLRANHAAVRQQILDHYGAVCKMCGETDPVVLAIDHVEGRGTAHRRGVGSPSRVYRNIIKEGFPSDYQILCHNCNWRKKIVEHGH